MRVCCDSEFRFKYPFNVGGTFYYRHRDHPAFIRISGMTHVRTSPFYPQSNGEIERRHKSLKRGVHPAGNVAVAR